MRLDDVSPAIGLSVVNAVVGALVGSGQPTPLVPVLALPLVAVLCGFLASRTRKLLVIVVETLCLLSLILMHYRQDMLSSLAVAYFFGLAAGLAGVRGGLEVGFGRPANPHSAVMSLGFSLLGAGVLGVARVPLVTPVDVIIREGPRLEYLASAIAVYSAQAYIASMVSGASPVTVALASLFTPYTLPLLSSLPGLGYAQPRPSRIPHLGLGRIVEVIRGPGARELSIPFRKGLNRNIVIVGATGAGKSTLAKSLVRQLGRLGIPAVVFDVHGEYCAEFPEYKCVEASEISVDIFKVYEEEPKSRVEFVVDAISELYSLGNLQRIALAKALSQVFYGGPREGAGFDYLLEYLSKASHGEVDLGVSATVVRSLIPYLEKLRDTFKPGGRGIEEVIDTITIIDYSRLSSGVSAIIAEIVADELYHTFRDLNRELVIVVEEAHRFLKRGRSISRVFREGRKYGISAILVTQDIGSVPRELLLNAAALISFSIPEPATARYIARIVASDDQALYERVINKLISLPQFRALALLPGVGSYVIEVRESPAGLISMASNRRR